MPAVPQNPAGLRIDPPVSDRERLVGRHRAVGKFVGGELAQDDPAAAFQAPHRFRVDRRHIVDLEMRVSGRPYASGFVDVL